MTTQAPGTTPFTGSKASGREIADWGARRVMLAEISSATITTGSVPFDHTTIGFDRVPALVFGSYIGSDHKYMVGGYDPTNKRIHVWDATDGDNGDGDTPSGRFVLVLVSE